MSQTFDGPELLRRLDNDWEFLADTVEMLSVDGRNLLEQLRRDVEARDAAAVARTAHTLKGMISNFCAEAAQASALAVESMGKSGDLSAAAPAIADLQSQLESLIGDLTQFVKTRA